MSMIPNDLNLYGQHTLNRNRWWETPGVTFGGGEVSVPAGAGGGGMRFSFVPDARDVPEDYRRDFGSDVQSFYNWYSGATPGARLTVKSTGRRADEARTARQLAIGGLRDVFGRVETSLTEFQEDPGREAIEEALRFRTTEGYRAISVEEEAAARNRIAQSFAQEEARRSGSAASRGALTSGITLNNLATLRAVADAGGVRLASDVAGRNTLARNEALGRLSSFEDREVAIEGQYLQALSAIEDEIARIRTGVEYEPTDFTAFESAAWGREQFERGWDMQTEELDRYEESLQPNWMDYVTFALGLRNLGVQDLFEGN